MTGTERPAELRSVLDARLLRSIPRGDLTPEQAAPEIRDYIMRGKSLGLLGSKCLELAWRAAVERRSDEELLRWHRLFREALSLMERLHPTVPHQLARLEDAAHLMSLSIQSEVLPDVAAVARRPSHLKVLELLRAQPDQYLSRTSIETNLDLQEGRISAYLHNLIFSGLVERDRRSATARYRITADGLAALGRHQATLS